MMWKKNAQSGVQVAAAPGGAGKEGVRVNNRFELVRHGATWGGAAGGAVCEAVRDVTGRGDEGLGCSGGGAKEVGGDLRPGAELRWFCAAGRRGHSVQGRGK